MTVLESIILAASLCADCFAVSLCSSVSLKKICPRSIVRVALGFAVIQTALLLVGWAFGSLLIGLVEKISKGVALVLLIYVGGGMLREGISGNEECRNLNGLRNVILGGIATSIDALSLGGFISMNHVGFAGFLPLVVSVFIITAISVVAGILGGKAIGSRFGRWAEIIGGVVLLAIGVWIML